MKNLHNLIMNDIYDAGGFCYESKGNIIKSLVEKSNAQLCVEIGVFKGSSLLYFAESLQYTGGKIIGIDPYEIESLKNEIPDPELSYLIYNVLFTEQKILDNMYLNLIKTINDNNLNNIITIIRDKSENFYTNIAKESIDVIHIDGNHNEEFVSKDIINYIPLVKKDGFIIMDDITWVGVQNSIQNHLIQHCSLINNYGDFAVYIKR